MGDDDGPGPDSDTIPSDPSSFKSATRQDFEEWGGYAGDVLAGVVGFENPAAGAAVAPGAELAGANAGGYLYDALQSLPDPDLSENPAPADDPSNTDPNYDPSYGADI